MLSGTEAPVRANLYFVLPPECKDEDEIEEEMKMAFQESEEAGLAPRWITEEKCMKKVGAKNDIFVLHKFEGELFNKLCKSKSGRVVGPRCLRTCVLEGLPIPETGSPVFTTAMRNLIITATQITAERKVEIKKMVGYMGGHYTNNLVESVTHLVTNVVRSAKYEKASEQGIPVMVEAWINAVWEASLTRNVRATDPEFEKYKCPIFLDMYITCSNLKRVEKEQMKELVTKHGGIFTPYLRQQETCLMVIKEPHGEKYKSAQAWGLPCVYPSWVLESVEKGYAVPSAKHLLMPKLKASTPTKRESQETANFTCSTDASISIIQHDTDKSHINETALSNATVTQQTQQINQQVTQLSQPRSVRSQKRDKDYKQVLSSIAIPQAKRAGPFLDGYKIFLSGFTSMETERLRRILSLGGATVFSSLTESVTHVIVGDLVPADAKAISSSGLRPHVVKLDWLSASIKQKGAADEEQYTYPDFDKTVPEPPSPLSQKVLRMLQPQENQQGNETSCLPKNDAVTIPRKLFKDFVNEANRDDSASQKDPDPLVTVNQNLAPRDASVNDYSSQSQSQSLNCSEMFKGCGYITKMSVGEDGIKLNVQDAQINWLEVQSYGNLAISGQVDAPWSDAIFDRDWAIPAISELPPRSTATELAPFVLKFWSFYLGAENLNSDEFFKINLNLIVNTKIQNKYLCHYEGIKETNRLTTGTTIIQISDYESQSLAIELEKEKEKTLRGQSQRGMVQTVTEFYKKLKSIVDETNEDAKQNFINYTAFVCLSCLRLTKKDKITFDTHIKDRVKGTYQNLFKTAPPEETPPPHKKFFDNYLSAMPSDSYKSRTLLALLIQITKTAKSEPQKGFCRAVALLTLSDNGLGQTAWCAKGAKAVNLPLSDYLQYLYTAEFLPSVRAIISFMKEVKDQFTWPWSQLFDQNAYNSMSTASCPKICLIGAYLSIGKTEVIEEMLQFKKWVGMMPFCQEYATQLRTVVEQEGISTVYGPNKENCSQLRSIERKTRPQDTPSNSNNSPQGNSRKTTTQFDYSMPPEDESANGH